MTQQASPIGRSKLVPCAAPRSGLPGDIAPMWLYPRQPRIESAGPGDERDEGSATPAEEDDSGILDTMNEEDDEDDPRPTVSPPA